MQHDKMRAVSQAASSEEHVHTTCHAGRQRLHADVAVLCNAGSLSPNRSTLRALPSRFRPVRHLLVYASASQWVRCWKRQTTMSRRAFASLIVGRSDLLRLSGWSNTCIIALSCLLTDRSCLLPSSSANFPPLHCCYSSKPSICTNR